MHCWDFLPYLASQKKDLFTSDAVILNHNHYSNFFVDRVVVRGASDQIDPSGFATVIFCRILLDRKSAKENLPSMVDSNWKICFLSVDSQGVSSAAGHPRLDK